MQDKLQRQRHRPIRKEAQLAHEVVATLGFGCIFVAMSDNVVTTLPHCVSDVITMTKN